MRVSVSALAILSLMAMTGCMAETHRAAVRDDTGDRLTVGTVQREIRVGMTSAQVAEVLGSPNVVTTDEQRREVWVYDKIATESVSSTSSAGVGVLIIGGVAGGGGIATGSSGASSTSQRTLTVIIKFDEHGKVRDFGYRQSSF
jgi:outer membrane protein assembly factor BamE (lipoprotein component of BamABCDE complex)